MNAIDLLAVSYREDELSVSTDSVYTLHGRPRANGKWAVYCRGRKLHGELPSSEDARFVKDLYVLGVEADDPRWGFYGGKQPSPRSDDVRRARGEIPTPRRRS